MDRHDQIGAAPWNLGFSVDLVRCGLGLGIIGRGPVPAAHISLCCSLAMARPLRQARQEHHKTTERLARRQALGGHDTVVREAKVPVQARYAETCNPPMTHAMPSPSSRPRRRLIQNYTPYETELLFKDVPQINLDHRPSRVTHTNNTALDVLVPSLLILVA